MRIISSIALAVVLTGCSKTTTTAPPKNNPDTPADKKLVIQNNPSGNTETSTNGSAEVVVSNKETTKVITKEPEEIPSVVETPARKRKSAGDNYAENGQALPRLFSNSTYEPKPEAGVKPLEADDEPSGLSRLFSGQDYVERPQPGVNPLETKDRQEAINIGYDMRQMFEVNPEEDEEDVYGLFNMFGEEQEEYEPSGWALPKGLMAHNVVSYNAEVKQALDNKVRSLIVYANANEADIEDVIERDVRTKRTAGYDRVRVADVDIDLNSYEAYLTRTASRILAGVAQADVAAPLQ